MEAAERCVAIVCIRLPQESVGTDNINCSSYVEALEERLQNTEKYLREVRRDTRLIRIILSLISSSLEQMFPPNLVGLLSPAVHKPNAPQPPPPKINHRRPRSRGQIH